MMVFQGFRKMIRAFLTILALQLYSSNSFAAWAGPNGNACGTSCFANMQYYGNPYGRAPFYPYPSTRFHTMYGPTNYYFRPHGPSPYQPSNCVACMMRYNQFSSPMNYHGPGMPMSYKPVQIPFRLES